MYAIAQTGLVFLAHSSACDLLSGVQSAHLEGRCSVEMTSCAQCNPEETINANTMPTTVLIFGAGYDPAVDDLDPIPSATTNTMGRGLFIVNASNGNVIWQTGPGTQSVGYSSGVPYY